MIGQKDQRNAKRTRKNGEHGGRRRAGQSQGNEFEQRCGRIERHRTSPHHLEYLGSDLRKTAFPLRKRGVTERGGFEPPVRLNAHWFSKPAQSTTLPPLQPCYYPK